MVFPGYGCGRCRREKGAMEKERGKKHRTHLCLLERRASRPEVCHDVEQSLFSPG